MRRIVFVTACLLACAPRPLRVVDVAPDDGARISRAYHDRVTVIHARQPNGELLEGPGALVDDGRAMVTWNDRKVALDSSTSIRLRIHYVEGDRDVMGRGVVHTGQSPELMSAGTVLAIIGALAFGVTLFGASTQCPPEPPPPSGPWKSLAGGGLSDHAACGLGYTALGILSVGTVLGGVAIVFRGAATSVTLSF